jgi:hypothetical protein
MRGRMGGMRYSKLRIAWSALCGVVCLLLVFLWVRSHYVFDQMTFPLTDSTAIGFMSIPDAFSVGAGDRIKFGDSHTAQQANGSQVFVKLAAGSGPADYSSESLEADSLRRIGSAFFSRQYSPLYPGLVDSASALC